MGSTQIECVAEEGAEENICISGKKIQKDGDNEEGKLHNLCSSPHMWPNQGE